MIILSTNVPYFLSYCFIVFKTSASRNISFKLFCTIVNHFIGTIDIYWNNPKPFIGTL